MAANKTRVQVRGTIGKSVRLPAGGVTAAQLKAAIAAIPAQTVAPSAPSSGGSGTVTSIGISTSSLLLGGTNPVVAAGTISVDLTSTQLADLALAATAVQPAALIQQFISSAGWNSTSGAVQLSLTVPQDILIPYGCTLQQVYIATQGGTGSCTVSIKTAAFPAIPTSDITGGTPPAIASATSYSNSTLAGWTTNFAQGAMIRATLTANSGFTSVKIYLRFK